MRSIPLFLTLTAVAAFLAVPGVASAKHTKHAYPSPEAKAKAAHLARLAVKQKKAVRLHQAKLKTLPHAERVAVKRHDRLWQRKFAAQEASLSHARAVKQNRAARQNKAARLAKAAHHRHAAEVAAVSARKPARKTASGHARRLAAPQAAQAASVRKDLARRTTHARKLSAQAEAHQQNVARRQALAAFKKSKWEKQYRAHLANVHAAHNARVAAGRSHWAALHGDGSGGKSIRFWQTAAAGVPVKVISVDLNDPDVKVSAVMSRHGSGTSEPFRQMIERSQPNVAVTGTFFSLDNLQPVGDIVIDGSLVHFGGMGTALCITPDNQAQMVTCTWGRHHDWSPYDFVVACGPRLLQRGRVVLNPGAERFRDAHMLSPNSRIAVGITRGNTLFFVMTRKPIYLGKLARVMQSLGAKDAMNLDAGTSTGFYYNGATLAKPGRKLTNMIVVYGRRSRYEHALDQLAPAAYHRRVTQRVPQVDKP